VRTYCFVFVFQVMTSKFGDRDLPEFNNLTTLILDPCDFTRDTPTLLEFFLRHAPNLERLTLQNCEVYTSSLYLNLET
jgi:hypothetical protein